MLSFTQILFVRYSININFTVQNLAKIQNRILLLGQIVRESVLLNITT